MALQAPHKQVTYYDILEVPSSVSDDELKRAYRRLVRQWHPDRNRINARAATFKLKTINEAYAHLKEPGQRRRYDQMLKRQRDRLTPGNDNRSDRTGALKTFLSWLFMSDKR